MIPFETERLIIRRMSESDLEDFLAYQTLPEVMRFQPYEPATRESAIHKRSPNPAMQARIWHLPCTTNGMTK
jgi:RimJ/RimL family protein N-acetyltransferase